MTPLDQAHAAMEASGDEADRMAYFSTLAMAELFLVLESEPTGETMRPKIVPFDEGATALAFDLEARLAALADGAPLPTAALSGRALVQLLADQGLGLGLNLGGEGAPFLLDAPGVTWLADVLRVEAEEQTASAQELAPPAGLPDQLLTALDRAFLAAEGRADSAFLAKATYADGSVGHLLAIIDPLPGAEGALTQTLGEALRLSGLEAGALDIAFLRASDPRAAVLARVGLRIALPQPQPAERPGPDPTKPPKLR